MSGDTCGHPAGPEWEGHLMWCPICGTWHELHRSPLDFGAAHGPDEEPEAWAPGPEPPHIAGNAEWPSWCLGEPPVFGPEDDDRPAWSYSQVYRSPEN